MPSDKPFSYEQMPEIDLDPASPGISAEHQVIEREDSVQRAREIAALRNVIDGLDSQHREVMTRLLATDKLNQAQVARDMGLTRARVSQLVAEVKPLTRHSLKLHIARRIPDDPGIVATKNVTLRERLTRLLLGTPRKVMIHVPGDSVKQIDITENTDDDLIALADALKAGEYK